MTKDFSDTIRMARTGRTRAGEPAPPAPPILPGSIRERAMRGVDERGVAWLLQQRETRQLTVKEDRLLSHLLRKLQDKNTIFGA